MSPLIHGNTRLELETGQTLFDHADSLHVRVPTSCGRTGECHECIVEIKQGWDALSPATEPESFLRGDYRLACQARVVDSSANVEFAVLRRQPRILTRGIRRDVKPDPFTVREDDKVVFKGPGGPRVIDKYRGSIFGLAVDLGTTTVVMNLVDMETASVVRTASFENPQRFGGSDIMNRISYDGSKFPGELQAVMLSSINFEIGEMCRTKRIRRRQIYELVVAGNSTMRDLFFGLDVQPIGLKPYRSSTETDMLENRRDTTAIYAAASDLGVRIHPNAVVYGGPLVGSHVGADVAADMLAVGIDEQTEPVMLVDVGTNTEVVVGTKDRLLAASCPAGPAFEGGEVKYGMPGYEGAVEAVSISNGRAACRTIGDAEPQGICGSGLIDLLAELRRNGIMTELGQLDEGMSDFAFVPEKNLTLSRSDISALAQAKAANFCGQSIVLRRYGLPMNDFRKLYLAGGFANYVNAENAIAIGFIAGVPEDRIEKVGNASLEGATIMLMSGPMRSKIEELVKTVEHVELETEPDFFDFFVEGCHFKPLTSPV